MPSRAKRAAPVFAALGDDTRLKLLRRLSDEPRQSISRLAEGATITRQGVTKHLRVLEDAGLVQSVRRGREKRYELKPNGLDAARRSLNEIGRQWDEALASLKTFVEKGDA